MDNEQVKMGFARLDKTVSPKTKVASPIIFLLHTKNSNMRLLIYPMRVTRALTHFGYQENVHISEREFGSH